MNIIIKNIAIALTLMTGLSAHATIISFDTITGEGRTQPTRSLDLPLSRRGLQQTLNVGTGSALKKYNRAL
jgi:hypothetical protein